MDQELLLHNEYFATKNRILRHQIQGRLRLDDADRITLAEVDKRLGRKALEEAALIVRPETILAWHRRLVAKNQRHDMSVVLMDRILKLKPLAVRKRLRPLSLIGLTEDPTGHVLGFDSKDSELLMAGIPPG